MQAVGFGRPPKKLSDNCPVFVHNVVCVTTLLMPIVAQRGKFCYNLSVDVGLISFDVGTFTSYVRKPEENVRFHQVTSNGNFLAKLKAALSYPTLATAVA